MRTSGQQAQLWAMQRERMLQQIRLSPGGCARRRRQTSCRPEEGEGRRGKKREGGGSAWPGGARAAVGASARGGRRGAARLGAPVSDCPLHSRCGGTLEGAGQAAQRSGNAVRALVAPNLCACKRRRPLQRRGQHKPSGRERRVWGLAGRGVGASGACNHVCLSRGAGASSFSPVVLP